jgi:hypothetical protein
MELCFCAGGRPTLDEISYRYKIGDFRAFSFLGESSYKAISNEALVSEALRSYSFFIEGVEFVTNYYTPQHVTNLHICMTHTPHLKYLSPLNTLLLRLPD